MSAVQPLLGFEVVKPYFEIGPMNEQLQLGKANSFFSLNKQSSGNSSCEISKKLSFPISLFQDTDICLPISPMYKTSAPNPYLGKNLQ